MSMEDAENYIRHSFAKIGTLEFLNEIKDNLCCNDKEVVLDVGCGPGNITAGHLCNFLPNNSTIVGCDISERMIDYASTNYANKYISFKVIDICDENLWSVWKKGEFSKIFSFYCLHRVPKLRYALENIYNLLTPGGNLISTIVIQNNWDFAYKRLAKDPRFTNYSKQLLSVVSEENFANNIIELLKTIGFEVTLNSIRSRSKVFPSIDDAISFVCNISCLSTIFPQNIIDEVMDEIKNNYDKLGVIEHSEDGYAFRHEYLSFIAKKPV